MHTLGALALVMLTLSCAHATLARPSHAAAARALSCPSDAVELIPEEKVPGLAERTHFRKSLRTEHRPAQLSGSQPSGSPVEFVLHLYQGCGAWAACDPFGVCVSAPLGGSLAELLERAGNATLYRLSSAEGFRPSLQAAGCRESPVIAEPEETRWLLKACGITYRCRVESFGKVSCAEGEEAARASTGAGGSPPAQTTDDLTQLELVMRESDGHIVTRVLQAAQSSSLTPDQLARRAAENLECRGPPTITVLDPTHWRVDGCGEVLDCRAEAPTGQGELVPLSTCEKRGWAAGDGGLVLRPSKVFLLFRREDWPAVIALVKEQLELPPPSPDEAAACPACVEVRRAHAALERLSLPADAGAPDSGR